MAETAGTGQAPGPLARVLAPVRSLAPGIALSLTVAAAAGFVADHYGGPVMLMALLIGMALAFLSEGPRAGPGIKFSSKKILRIGVALLGLRIAVSDVVGLGAGTVGLVLAGIAITIAAALLAARIAGESSRLGTLIGGATAICGASAALAISSVLPRGADHERNTIFTVVAVTTLSTIAMVLYPVLFQSAGFTDREIGILIGATIHDVAQVVGAGYAVSGEAGDTATIVKLMRVAMLLPLVLAVSFAFAAARKAAASGAKAELPIPGFAIAFAILVGVNSMGIMPEPLREALIEVSRWCLITAVAAVGLTTSLREIAKVGWPPVLIAISGTLVLLVFCVAVLSLHIV
ncbi:MAG: putative sulfate exporter family transporter [Pseudomonadota bacterium]